MSKGKVLVVDDEADIVKTVSLRLKSRGYEVVTAMDGVQATNVAFREKPDVIILDIGMPAGDGHTVAKRLAESVQTFDTPIIFLTARVNENDYQRAFEEGVSKYIAKPYKPEELLSSVDELMQRVQKV